ncbi:unnamed protein product [Vicia faba]|uniref:Uncharacterized protein n=1 Tax=Vicia faba TaxID=3906 RepID=A0AAV0ZS32_VICFA|nr:unnamed protein product [Vicia faba]
MVKEELVASNTTSKSQTRTNCETRSSNSDTEASESCNIQSAKRRKMPKKIVRPSRGWEMETQVPETHAYEAQDNEAQTNETQNSPKDDCRPFIVKHDLPNKIVKMMLTIAKEEVIGRHFRPFSLMEASFVRRRMLEYGGELSISQVMVTLNTILREFTDFCALMKKGMKGVDFDYKNGEFYTSICDEETTIMLHNRFRYVTSNFEILKNLFDEIYEASEPSKSKKRKSTTGTSGRSKKSKSLGSISLESFIRVHHIAFQGEDIFNGNSDEGLS